MQRKLVAFTLAIPSCWFYRVAWNLNTYESRQTKDSYTMTNRNENYRFKPLLLNSSTRKRTHALCFMLFKKYVFAAANKQLMTVFLRKPSPHCMLKYTLWSLSFSASRLTMLIKLTRLIFNQTIYLRNRFIAYVCVRVNVCVKDAIQRLWQMVVCARARNVCTFW